MYGTNLVVFGEILLRGTLKFITWKIMGILCAFYEFPSSEQLQEPVNLVNAGIAV